MCFIPIPFPLAVAWSLADIQTVVLDGSNLDLMSLWYIVSPITVQGYASDYKALSLRHPINHLQSPFLFIFISLIIWNCFPHCLIIIYTQSTVTLLQSSHCSPRLTSSLPYQSDCPYHAGISLILTLLSCSTSIEP